MVVYTTNNNPKVKPNHKTNRYLPVEQIHELSTIDQSSSVQWKVYSTSSSSFNLISMDLQH